MRRMMTLSVQPGRVAGDGAEVDADDDGEADRGEARSTSEIRAP